ncbi:hypothetical protein P7K49_032833 [Saguinus oedipus]|uniref:Uncharacterized protein n=1 Tax=Saguinus oedipus TaxID=9490 RepID=A0ABQ9TQ76_SAGOE|nr:hypothetical protein P7K49_032833 [Saguinus oedipus]
MHLGSQFLEGRGDLQLGPDHPCPPQDGTGPRGSQDSVDNHQENPLTGKALSRPQRQGTNDANTKARMPRPSADTRAKALSRYPRQGPRHANAKADRH